MKHVSLGPERNVPSWNWVGFDTSRELSKYYNISTFDGDHIPDCDVAIIIKHRMPNASLDSARKRGIKIIYAPIDFYNTPQQIKGDSEYFRKCSMILTHSERLTPFIEPYNRNIRFVSHNNKYALPEVKPYKSDGYVLWIGGCQYIPFLLRWLETHPLDCELKILADIETKRARQAADFLAHELRLKLYMTQTHVNQYEAFNWSERIQYDMLMECRAAIDIKGSGEGSTLDFNQYTKPPTKAEKYIASGIPFAVNSDSYSYEHFDKQGLKLAVPQDTRRWFSKEYWQDVSNHAKKVREETSIEAVGRKFKSCIDSL